MATFDGSTQVRTRVKLDGDRFQPNMGSLKSKGSPVEKFLIKGTREEEIHRNWKYTVWADVTGQVNGSVSVRIRQNDSRTVLGNAHYQILGTTYQFFAQAHQTFNGATKVSFFLGSLTETHCQPRQIIEPTNLYKVIGFKGEVVTLMSQTNNVSKVEFNGIATAVSGYKCDLAMLKTDAKTIENKGCVLKTEATALKAIAGALKAGVNAARAKVAALGMLIGVRAGGPPTSLGAN